MKRIILYLMLCGLMIHSQANNIQVSNLSITGQNYSQHFCLVEFDLTWENSWRNDTTPPFNWDAAWVFIKYKNLAGEWHHATLNVTGHAGPDSATISPAEDGKGVFIYRKYSSHGFINWSDIRLRWNYGTDRVPDDASLEIGVYAIEMVYVPEGNFYLGDRTGSEASSQGGFYLTESTNYSALISSDYTTVSAHPNAQGDGWGIRYMGIGIDGDGGIDSIPENQTMDNSLFPTGYKSFYVMKYEISQEQFRDFLNSLTRAQQNKRVHVDISGTSTDTVYVLSRTLQRDANNSICVHPPFSTWMPLQFYCELNKKTLSPPSFDPDSIDDGQTYACGYITWMDGAAYSDWAGLRPMTELEYEKACRGPNYPVTYEYAWGTTAIHSPVGGYYTYNHEYRGWFDEIITNTGENTGNANYCCLGTGGPVRCGIYAASSINHTKAEAGSTYYGIMEMSGNLEEMTVHVGNQAGMSFTGLHGNGELNSNGEADVDYWPGIGGNNNPAVQNSTYSGVGVTAAGGAGFRGGAYNGNTQDLRVSLRFFAGYSELCSTVRDPNGFRCVRSAPVQ